MGIISTISQVGTMQTGVIALSINGVEKQRGDLKMMIWSVPKIIAYLSRFNKLEAGDIIMTGTPAGVGPVQKGDKLVASIAGLTTLEVVVV